MYSVFGIFIALCIITVWELVWRDKKLNTSVSLSVWFIYIGNANRRRELIEFRTIKYSILMLDDRVNIIVERGINNAG